MEDQFEYIESYFNDRQQESERKQFEERCVNDEAFSKEVALYALTRQAVRDQLLQQKMAEWRSLSNTPHLGLPARGRTVALLLRYAAAACIVVAIATYTISRPGSARREAAHFIQGNLLELSQTMGESVDSVQQALVLYNNKKYDQALELFDAVYASHPQNADALKYSGLVDLVTKRYDDALLKFKKLESNEHLYANPGMFYESLTLLMRNQDQDKQTAKALLQKVIDQKQVGAEEAKVLIQKL